MARVLVTGMSGAGKSTLLSELERRGHVTVDTDHDGWHRASGGWDTARMQQLLASTRDAIVAGIADNQGEFYDRFDHVLLLSAPLPALLDRVRGRADNPYGTTPVQQAEIAHYVVTVEPLLRRGATGELDGLLPTSAVADAVEALLARLAEDLHRDDDSPVPSALISGLPEGA